MREPNEQGADPWQAAKHSPDAIRKRAERAAKKAAQRQMSASSGETTVDVDPDADYWRKKYEKLRAAWFSESEISHG